MTDCWCVPAYGGCLAVVGGRMTTSLCHCGCVTALDGRNFVGLISKVCTSKLMKSKVLFLCTQS